MILYPDQRTKLDTTEDTLFYALPRFVTHVDDSFIHQLTNLYRQVLQTQTKVLDLMSSWVSHLPGEMTFAHVEGHGMNREELNKNPRLDHFFVQDLNINPHIPLPDQTFDAIINCVSVQYLQYPDAIFHEIYRILKPGGVVVISFSNRMFYQKAIQIWRESTEPQRLALVQSYFKLVPGFSSPNVVATVSPTSGIRQWLGMGGGDPFYAIIAHRKE